MLERFRIKISKDAAPENKAVKPKKVEFASRSNPEVKKKLEEQFNRPEIFDFGNSPEDLGEDSRTEVYDVRPENLKSEVPVYLAPGWSATPMAHKENILAIAEAGREVISPNTPHGLNIMPKNEWPLAEVKKVEAILKTLERKKIEKTDIIAHSEGALNAVMAATLYPEKFRNIVLLNPAGLVGPDDWQSLIKRFLEDVQLQAKRDKDPEVRTSDHSNASLLEQAKGPANTVGLSPIRAFKEIQAIAAISIEGLLKNLHDQGIKIAIVHTVDDKVFPMARLNNMVKSKDIDGFYSVQGTHNEIFMRPEYYARFLEGVLSDLEKKPSIAS